MENTSLTSLIQDLALVIAQTGLKLEQLADKYYSLKGGKASKDHPGSSFYQQEPSEYENTEKQDGIQASLDSIQKQTKTNVFLYFIQTKEPLIFKCQQEQDIQQLMSKAATEFRSLAQDEKMQYIRSFVFQYRQKALQNSLETPSQGLSSLPKEHFVQNMLHLEEDSVQEYLPSRYSQEEIIQIIPLYDQREANKAFQATSIFQSLNPLINNNSDFTELFQKDNQKSKDVLKLPKMSKKAILKEEKAEGKSKGDIYKMAIKTKMQRTHKSDEREEDSKEKAQLAVLKSLFKKLQSLP